MPTETGNLYAELPGTRPAPALFHPPRHRGPLKPSFRISNGGQDANWITRHGVPTITIGAGQDEIHTVRESVNLAEFADGCRLAVALATMAE